MAAVTKVLIAILVAVAVMMLLRSLGKTSGTDARALVEKGAKLVDVRTTGEFEAGHLPKAIHIPVQALDGRTAELGAKDQPIVVYCASGARSARAKRLLEKHGFTAVHDLGAMGRW